VTSPPPSPERFFDFDALQREMAVLHKSKDTAADRRTVVVGRLKALVTEVRGKISKQLDADGNGRRCASQLSAFQDDLIRLLYEHTVRHVYHATNPSDAERMAIVATGGYGRGLLAPHSDIDLLFLLPYKQTPWGESVAEVMLYVLWDLGFKVGHATRNTDQCLKFAVADTTIRTSLLDARLIHGDAQLFAELAQRFRTELVRGTGRAFVDAKMAERDQRHKRSGESRYLVETARSAHAALVGIIPP
jgi:[protein-PII] uridylyltransferase